MKSENGLSSVRVNFLKAFEKDFGRKPITTRKELLDYEASWEPGRKGGSGMTLRFPSWLTNSDQYRVGRGSFKLPWDELDQWNSAVPAVSAPATVSP